jgi:hypothetical protein
VISVEGCCGKQAAKRHAAQANRRQNGATGHSPALTLAQSGEKIIALVDGAVLMTNSRTETPPAEKPTRVFPSGKAGSDGY